MLNEKVALITGASRGIGRAIAQKFAKEGAHIAAVYCGSEQKALELKDEIEKNGGKINIYKCDVSNFAECENTVKKVIEDFGGVDILVNNAGITNDKLVLQMGEDDFDSVIGTNLKGAFNMIKHCYRNFMKKKYGKIINTHGIRGELKVDVYCDDFVADQIDEVFIDGAKHEIVSVRYHKGFALVTLKDISDLNQAMALKNKLMMFDKACVELPEGEYFIADLIGFLRAAGADISGAGTSSLQICGVSRLHGATYTILPDRIETATYLCMAAGCGGETELLRCDARLLLPVIERLREAGCEISADADRIVLRSSGRLLPLLPVSTAPYPGFPTDAQALLMAAVLKAAGGSEFRETIFERRFLHVPELRKLGADIQVAGSTARVRGVSQLHGAKLRAEDLRGAAALLTASMMAEGESELTGLCHLLRGYEKPEQNLKNLGASIKSVDIPAPFVYNT